MGEGFKWQRQRQEPIVYLYNEGDKCTNLTGGWDEVYAGTTNPITWNLDNVVMAKSSALYNGIEYRTLIFTTNSLNLQNYSTLNIEYSLVDGRTTNIYDSFSFGVSSNKLIGYEPSLASFRTGAVQDCSTTTTTSSLNISSIISGYVFVHVINYVTATITKIWLE